MDKADRPRMLGTLGERFQWIVCLTASFWGWADASLTVHQPVSGVHSGKEVIFPTYMFLGFLWQMEGYYVNNILIA